MYLPVRRCTCSLITSPLFIQISLLLPLVKSRQLLLPGHIDPLDATKDFKLFLTQRSVLDIVENLVFSLFSGNV